MYDADPLDADRLRELVVGEGLWRQVDVVAETGSTNADLAARAAVGDAGHGSVLLTSYQSSGRGRLDRTWSAPPGSSLAMSMLVVPGDLQDGPGWQRWTWLPLICGMAVSEAIRRATGVPTVLKWPNDVMVGDRKLCGILAEQVSTPQGLGCVIGVGINTDLTEDQLPVPWATSLLLCGASTRNKTSIAATVLRAFALLYANWHDDFDADALGRAYVERCATIGREVRVVLSERESVTGQATALDADGRLVVRTADGTQVFGAGDITHLR
ncbi:biotin--[acetyl-CoA-carboxylase] ligase [Microlunatus endophyticus]|nr:biotin--[acetyl-CoA-carboxylase] ligase [Microlunatus endophyticus]